jgi:hypothetical protein
MRQTLLLSQVVSLSSELSRHQAHYRVMLQQYADLLGVACVPDDTEDLAASPGSPRLPQQRWTRRPASSSSHRPATATDALPSAAAATAGAGPGRRLPQQQQRDVVAAAPLSRAAAAPSRGAGESDAEVQHMLAHPAGGGRGGGSSSGAPESPMPSFADAPSPALSARPGTAAVPGLHRGRGAERGALPQRPATAAAVKRGTAGGAAAAAAAAAAIGAGEGGGGGLGSTGYSDDVAAAGGRGGVGGADAARDDSDGSRAASSATTYRLPRRASVTGEGEGPLDARVGAAEFGMDSGSGSGGGVGGGESWRTIQDRYGPSVQRMTVGGRLAVRAGGRTAVSVIAHVHVRRLQQLLLYAQRRSCAPCCIVARARVVLRGSCGCQRLARHACCARPSDAQLVPVHVISLPRAFPARRNRRRRIVVGRHPPRSSQTTCCSR